MAIRRVLSVIILPLILSAALAGCSGAGHDPRLERVAEAVDSSPADALSLLDSIDRESLGEKDRHYHDFLTVKARDKAYITHTSDSLIQSVIGYYGKHDKDLYPEALYYGGRVYSDLGDFPTALGYYQNALDQTSEKEDEIALRGKIVSQMGSVLRALRLYDKAISYAKESLRLSSLQNDLTGMMYEEEQLGSLYVHTGNYDLSAKHFQNALSLADSILPSYSGSLLTYLAWVDYRKGNLDSAVRHIRSALAAVDSIYRNGALSCAAIIYNEAGIRDTAMMYARELIQPGLSPNRKNGYQVILSDPINGKWPVDTLLRYIRGYRDEIEAYLDKNGNREALMQDSLYNYQLHERERLKAEKDKERLYVWLFCTLSAVFLLASVLLWIKNRDKSQRLQLIEAIDIIKTLRAQLDRSSHKDNGTVPPYGALSPVSSTVGGLRQRLREELLTLNDNKRLAEIATIIMESDAFSKVKEYLDKGHVITDKNPLWKDLEDVVTECSPTFRPNLRLLAGGDLSILDYHLALLIKCGLSPSNAAILIGKAKNTVTYHRRTLGKRLLAEEMDYETLDNIIRLL